MGNPFDSYKNNGLGVFIADGTGVTLFIALLQQLEVNENNNGSQLFFANKKEKDISLADEIMQLLGKNFINVLAEEETQQYAQRLIHKNFLQQQVDNLNKQFYLCAPPVLKKI